MLNMKFLNLSLSTWALVIVVIILFFFMNNDENFAETEGKTNENVSNKTTSKELNDASEKSDNIIKVYNFNTLWCGYSRQFQPNWDKFADMNDDSDVEIVDVKCDNETNKELCTKYSIPGFPTVLFVKGDKVGEYSGDRSVDDLKGALENFKNSN